MGYDLKEIQGQHHRMFCNKDLVKSDEYKLFWENLAKGITQADEYERITKSGEIVWLAASYTPLADEDGKISKIIKIASDVTNVKNPILGVKDVIESMAAGDLTKEFDVKSEGYVQEMGDALNLAIENLNGLLGDINESSTLLASSSEQMMTKSDQMQGTTQQVATAIGQMAEGVADQAKQIDESSNLIEEVRVSADTMGTQSESINKAAKNGQSNAKKGLGTVKKVVESITFIFLSFPRIFLISNCINPYYKTSYDAAPVFPLDHSP